MARSACSSSQPFRQRDARASPRPSLRTFVGGHDHWRRRLRHRGETIRSRGQNDLHAPLAAGRRSSCWREKNSPVSPRSPASSLHASEPMRKKIIAANWKMNVTIDEAEGFLREPSCSRSSARKSGSTSSSVPPFTTLAARLPAPQQSAAQRKAWRAKHALGKIGRLHGRDQRAPCCASSSSDTSSSATASAARFSARRMRS